MSVIREQCNSLPIAFTDKLCIAHWPETMTVLKELGWDMGYELNDLTETQELDLGKLVKERYNTDFYIIDKYPSLVRPSYTAPVPLNQNYSNSYDMLL